MYIRNLNGFLKDIDNGNNTHYYCENCLSRYQKKEKLEFHKSLCLKNNTCKLIMPVKKG